MIDFQAFLTGDEATEIETAKAILTGFQRAGFIYLHNFGIDKDTVQKTFQQSAQFFKRPLSQKEDLSWTTPEANRGYVRQGREKTSDLLDEGDVAKQREVEGEDVSKAHIAMLSC